MKKREVFICHVDEDRDLAESLARELEATGCTAWYYERDSIPGLSYLFQTRQAIDQAKCFLFIVSRSAIERGHQVGKELVHAHEVGKDIIPILRDLSFRSFQKARPEWHQAIGAIVGVEWSSPTVESSLQRLFTGLKALGIVMSRTGTSVEEAARGAESEQSCGVQDVGADERGDDIALTVSEDSDDDAEGKPDRDYILATIVHEHPETGFLADVVVTEAGKESLNSLCIGFSHELLKPNPYIVEFQLGSDQDPVQYYRFPKLIYGYPLLLRVYWLRRLPDWSMFNKSFGVTAVPSVRTGEDQHGHLVAKDAAGILVKDQFKEMIAQGERLPRIQKKRFHTLRDSQKAVSVTPAVCRPDGSLRRFSTLKLSLPVASAGVAWMEFAFRVDPDGRYTVLARDPLHNMKIRDLIVVQ